MNVVSMLKWNTGIIAVLLAFSASATTLFEDNFNRTTVPNDNVDADVGGMGGVLVSNGTLGVDSTWNEPFDWNTGNDHRAWVRSDHGGELAIAESSAGTSHVIIDHNFIDGEILSDGGLKISIDLVGIESPTSDDRYLGFGAGMTAAESMGYADRYIRSTADFFAGMNSAGEVIVYLSGSQIFSQDFGAINVLDGGTLTAILKIPEFDAGAAVEYDVYLSHPVLTSGTNQLLTSDGFTWGDDNSNYIGIDGRAAVRVVGDNFSISTVLAQTIALEVVPNGLPVSTGMVALAWIETNIPTNYTYEITADRSVTFPNDDGVGTAGNGGGSVVAWVNDASGDTTFTITIRDGLGQWVASSLASVVQQPPQATLSVTPSRIEGTGTVALTWAATSFPAGSTYSVSADKPVDYPSDGQTGSLDVGSGAIAAIVDSANGETTFTMVYFNQFAQPLLTNTATVAVGAPPNILVILFDDTGWSDFGCYGGEVQTPNIDSLAANGLRFRNFYQAARCSPTRCAILSGLYTQQAAASPEQSLPDLNNINNVTIAEVLKASGYRTYMAGKWHLGTSTAREPRNRGFDHVFGQGVAGDGANPGDSFGYWTASNFHITSTNNEIPERTYTNQFHYTDAIGDYVVDFIDHSIAKNDGKPFFIYMPFNAPHWPVNGPGELADKYTDVGDPNPGDVDVCLYEEGWDVIRQKKYERQLAMGVIDERFKLSPKGDHPASPIEPIPDWDILSAQRKEDLARRNAVYASMIEQDDMAIGKVIQRLRDTGQLDNTFLFIVCDNGANYEGGLFGNDSYLNGDVDGLWATADLPAMGQPRSKYDELGIPYTRYPRVNQGGGWANVSNTPFRLFKHFTHNGGIRTAAIAHWPNGMDESIKGSWTDQIGHLIDVMATVVDVTGAEYPDQFAGHAVLPMEGTTLQPTFHGQPMAVRDVAVEHEDNRAFFRGDWKLVTKKFSFSNGSSPAHQLELYNLVDDPCELNNLASVETGKLKEMVEAWNIWCTRVYRGLSTPPLLGNITVDSFPALAPSSQDLFYDTFARPDNSNVDASYVGMSGRYFAQLGRNSAYYQGFGSSSVNGTQLRVQTADNGLMRNFIGQDILDAGGFSISMNVVEMNSSASAGLGIGLSQAEASSAVSGLKNASDCFVELDSAGSINLYLKGVLAHSVSVGSATGLVTAAFSASGFSTSDFVGVSVYFNGTPIMSGADFNWDVADQNYLGIGASASGYVLLDNLAVRLFPIGDSLARVYAMGSGLSGYATDSAQDIEGDSLDNYAEWVWGGDPKVADYNNSKVLMVQVTELDGFEFRYRRMKNSEQSGIIYHTYAGIDLQSGNWMPMAVNELGVETAPDNADYEIAHVQIPSGAIGTNQVMFVQVRAESSD